MATNILMPALSPTMTEGTLARWLKKEGENVRAGDVIAEIETDKATMEVEAVDEGVLGKILVADGTAGVKVNDPIAVLVEKGEAVPTSAAPVVKAAPAPQAVTASGTADKQAATAAPAPIPAHGGDIGRLFASPLARRIAKEKGVDLSKIKGSGPNGRIVRADVERAPAGGAAPQSMPVTAASMPGATTLVPHSTMRRVIAKRLTEAKQTVPHFYLSMDIELDALLSLRTQLNAHGEGPSETGGGFKLSVNDMVIKAAALALKKVPGVNASFTEDGTVFYSDVDISVAVAIPDGLITPIIRQADRKNVVVISQEAKDLFARARAGKLKPEEFQGGGFSISNLGMFGIRDFAAIVNPPQGAILAVGAGEKRAVVRAGDQLAVATVMTCTLSVDHRVVDGALGAEWLQVFKRIVEQPLSLML